MRYDGQEPSTPDLQFGSSSAADVTTMLEWHRSDPLDDYERGCVEKVCEQFQGNRNHFVEFPQLAEIVFGNGTSTDIPSVAATSSRSLGFTQSPTNVNGGLCNFLVVTNIYYQNIVMAKCEEISAYNSVYDLYERVVWRRADPVALLVAFHSSHEHFSLYLTTQL